MTTPTYYRLSKSDMGKLKSILDRSATRLAEYSEGNRLDTRLHNLIREVKRMHLKLERKVIL